MYNNLATVSPKLQALVYDMLPSTTAVFSYAIGPRKLSANEQFFFGGAQTVVNLLKTTQNKTKREREKRKKEKKKKKRRIIYSRQQSLHQYKENHNSRLKIETELLLFSLSFFYFLFFTRGGCASCLLRACFGAVLLPALVLCCFQLWCCVASTVFTTQTFQSALSRRCRTATRRLRVSAPSVCDVTSSAAEIGGRCVRQW